MNPFADAEFLKCIKRSYIMKQMLREDKKFEIAEFDIKLNNNIITIIIKLNNNSNIYKYQYVPKEKQITTEIVNNKKKVKHKYKKDDEILNLENKFENMMID
jgi:hypothetical protein